MPLIREDEFTRSVDDLVRTRSPLPPAPPGPRLCAETGPAHPAAGGGLPDTPPHPATGGRLPDSPAHPAAGGRLPLEEVLRGRRSVRAFTAEPLPLDTLTAVLGLAEHSYLSRHAPGGPLTTLLALRRVGGLAPGLYHPSPSGAYAELPESPPSADWPRAFADAPALIFIGGAVVAASGDSYGGLLVHAGALGHTIWLAARTYGLDCSVFGQPDSGVTRAMRRHDPGVRHLFTVALGRRRAGDS
ncbi:hypothetical protein Misp01_81340 [Microtetraspora sp. NBRC 13810]|uniref:nitroreductase family protein n=1 Tax=Microtetraspora sp. NBRC 13810 TaxID=3030990 RepID=UPI0024A5F2FF|nr:nitroreductase family protein [Microtetraspora sp. NBRC 13810]GLW13006.1 hypothetical protein Misp01_81340 [Microtetraspora sp. NBRC 13810]